MSIENVVVEAGTEVVAVATQGFFTKAVEATVGIVCRNPIAAACVGVAVIGAAGYGGYRYVNRDKAPAVVDPLAAFNAAMAAAGGSAAATAATAAAAMAAAA
jgi:hypothetical protein